MSLGYDLPWPAEAWVHLDTMPATYECLIGEQTSP